MVLNDKLLKSHFNSVESLIGIQTRSLKEGLIEHFDYEAVSLDIWSYLESWFDTDNRIERQV